MSITCEGCPDGERRVIGSKYTGWTHDLCWSSPGGVAIRQDESHRNRNGEAPDYPRACTAWRRECQMIEAVERS